MTFRLRIIFSSLIAATLITIGGCRTSPSNSTNAFIKELDEFMKLSKEADVSLVLEYWSSGKMVARNRSAEAKFSTSDANSFLTAIKEHGGSGRRLALVTVPGVMMVSPRSDEPRIALEVISRSLHELGFRKVRYFCFWHGGYHKIDRDKLMKFANEQ